MAETKTNLAERTKGLLNADQFFGIDSGTANSYVITFTAAPSAYEVGRPYSFMALNANTGASTVNINGLGAVSIKKEITENLSDGDIKAGQIITVQYDGVNMQLLNASITIPNYFGDGSDGDVVISTNTTLTRDMYYNNLTVNSSITLTPNGFKVFVKEELIVNGTISAKGSNGGNGGNGGNSNSGGSPGTGGTAGVGETNGGVGSGGEGSNPAAAAPAAANATNSISIVNGVSGGNSTSARLGGTGNGAVGGTTTNVFRPSSLIQSFTLFNNVGIFTKGAASGGGRGGPGLGDDVGVHSFGGGGGGGASGGVGGILAIYAKKVTVSATGSITAAGGNGGNGGNGGTSRSSGATSNDYTGNGGGGGGGGSGGSIILVYAVLVNSGLITASGGNGGTGGSGGVPTVGQIGASGTAGANGLDGRIYYHQV